MSSAGAQSREQSLRRQMLFLFGEGFQKRENKVLRKRFEHIDQILNALGRTHPDLF